ncbi:MAG: SGNH/GDSL hydrolase family protein [Candidatus Limnocylindrales bacterium]
MPTRSRPLIVVRRRPAFAAVLVAIVALTLSSVAASAGSYPDSMASTGDSITRAFNTGFFPYTDNPSASWSTGTNSTVVSHYSRLLKLNGAIAGHAYNDAKSGARMVDLAGQLTTVASQHVGYVTILMGGNDVCQPTEAQMTSVADYTAQFSAAMSIITSGSPSTKVYVVSLPNVYNLWSILKGNASARFAWALFGVCQSMLADPLSTTQADQDRRARVLQREVDYNTALATVCTTVFAARCRFDNSAVFNTAFVASDISTRDYFHPSIAGQAKLAAVSWRAGYWGP